MRITKVHVSGFKFLANFELELAPFTCLIGMNGCGKSTVLQFFDFVSSILSGDVSKWLWERDWAAHEVKSFIGDQNDLIFEIEFSDGSVWGGTYVILEGRCVQEAIRTPTAEIFLHDGKLRGVTQGDLLPTGMSREQPLETAALDYRGSILNLFRDDGLPKSVQRLRRFFREARAFDSLSPHALRRSPGITPPSIGKSGEFLSAYLAALGSDVRASVLKDLHNIFPQLHDIKVLEPSEGQVEIATVERYELHDPPGFDERLVRSGHINDGLLRLIAMLVELRSSHSFLLFDEIENGISPEVMDFLVQKLSSSDHQVMVTTHSPMILNYLDDELARKSVVFLYKGPDGGARARRFFDIPSISQKLEVMGPGEAFVDTNLVSLTEELNAAVAGA